MPNWPTAQELGLQTTAENRIAFLATGDELMNGDALNSNGRDMAKLLRQQQLQPGQQLTVSDQQTEIATALLQLLDKHRVVVTIGGLGPTSDDRTRFAIGEALQRPMQYHEKSWQDIQQRFQERNIELTDNNKQQCYFAAGAEVIHNANGSANAAHIILGDRLICMLPGPPTECLPIFTEHSLPTFIKMQMQQPYLFHNWMLMGCAESYIASQIEKLQLEPGVDIGYRVSYPYLEIKCQAQQEQQEVFMVTVKSIQQCIQQYALPEGDTATAILQRLLKKQKITIAVDDQATGGILQSTMLNPESTDLWCFNKEDEFFHKCQIQYHISGLKKYWDKQNPSSDHIQIQTINNSRSSQETKETKEIMVRCYRNKTRQAATELFAQHVLQDLLK